MSECHCDSCRLDEIFELLRGVSDEVSCLKRRTPEWAERLLKNQERLNKGMAEIMGAVKVEQDDLDALATQLSDAVGLVGSELADLEAQLAAAIAAGAPLPDGSLDGLKAALTTLQGLEVPAPAPVEPPVDNPPAE